MSIQKRFEQFIAEENLFQAKDPLLIAVSGGIDSVALCELCAAAGYDFVIAHGNFQLRAEESERDEAFVKRLAARYDVKLHLKKFDTSLYASTNKVSIQVAARELRYDWFNEITEKGQSAEGRLILTAHYMDDSIETMLMNLFKGTGIAGLRGILPKQKKIVRPLLFAKKTELKQFVTDKQLDWVEDSSNDSDKYSRNYFRHQLIPLVEKIYPEAINNLGDNLQRFRETEILYQQSVASHKKKLVTKKGSEIHIPVLKLLNTSPLRTILYEIIKAYGFSSRQVDEIIQLLYSDTGKYCLSSTHRILRNRNWLIITALENQDPQIILIEEGQSLIDLPKSVLQIQQLHITNTSLPVDAKIAYLDAEKIKFPLLLRKWKQGDYFYPLGMQKKKKLSRFFIDQKLSLPAKENIWVIEMEKKIIWVMGLRIDDRFKVHAHTKSILKLSITP